MTARCSSCGASIVWAKTEAGRAMPLDAEPTDDGTIETIGNTCRVLSPIEAAITRGETGRLYTSHFATCPHAATHRRKKGNP